MENKKTIIIISLILMLSIFLSGCKQGMITVGYFTTQQSCRDSLRANWCPNTYACTDCSLVNGFWQADCLVGTPSYPGHDFCSSGCTSHASSACYVGDVYWYNSCGAIEEKRYDCSSSQTCTGGQCVNNQVCSSGQCNGNQYCQNGQWVTCSSGQTCSGGSCVSGTCSLLTPQYCSHIGARCMDASHLCSDTFIYNGYYYCAIDQVTCSQGCANNVCTTPPQCTSGTKECTSSTSYRLCAGGLWGASTPCSTSQTCSAGNCINTPIPKTCSELGKQCGTWDNQAGGTVSCGSCSGSQTCNNNGQCINDAVCVAGTSECTSTSSYKVCTTSGQWGNPTSCGASQTCLSGQCQSTAQCSGPADCNDNNPCTTDVCSGGQCSNPAIVCPEGLVCMTGQCLAPPACTELNAASVCVDGNQCTIDSCVSGQCSFAPIIGCGENNQTLCKAYEVKNAEEVCEFSFSALFTSAGISEFYSDNTAVIWVIAGIFVVLIILLIILLVTKKKEDNLQLWR